MDNEERKPRKADGNFYFTSKYKYLKYEVTVGKINVLKKHYETVEIFHGLKKKNT